MFRADLTVSMLEACLWNSCHFDSGGQDILHSLVREAFSHLTGKFDTVLAPALFIRDHYGHDVFEKEV